MSDQPANLQMTVKDAARLMNVSERSIYTARKITRLRPDLVSRIESGELSLNAAAKMITNRAGPTTYEKLIQAWNAASEDDQGRFLVAVGWRSK
ncbi:hypothetical protein [Rhizobium terrae]|uniref:hypothetical protein n=1 Tax=Rhizobium terrae TaxID=2171756 RepID=UPI000E3CD2DE|nr:hypothetical protein [Rhizobium terrae]